MKKGERIVKIYLIRTGQATRASRALLLEGTPHFRRMVKRPPAGIDSSRGMVAYGRAAGTRSLRKRPRPLANVTQWLALPFGWTLAVEGKRREHQIQVREE